MNVIAKLPIPWKYLASRASSSIPDSLQSLDKWQKTPPTQVNVPISSYPNKDSRQTGLVLVPLEAFMPY